MDSVQDFPALREAMVCQQLRRRGIRDERVLAAMNSVPRERFVPVENQSRAYADEPLPIGEEQTISQPYMVAVMSELLHLCGTEKVLEVGTGCGYHAAVLSLLGKEIHSIEVREGLAATAASRLAALGYSNVFVHLGDGGLGLPQHAPFDAILVAAAAPRLPRALLQQLSDGGRVIAPIGYATRQELTLFRCQRGEVTIQIKEGCRFVPLVGTAAEG